ncbi:MAG: hypothetical protein HZA88_20810 [Verrucomicrobia bacterium]|nr:hypothetical protein [Verrucomicrobiota bacterium]
MPAKYVSFLLCVLAGVSLLTIIVPDASASLTKDGRLSVLDEKTRTDMQAFGRNTMASAPAHIQNGTDLDKAKYLCGELCKTFANKNKTVNASNADRAKHDDFTDYTCGDLTERVKTVWVAAGIKAGFAVDIMADKNTWKPAFLDPNYNHGAPALTCNGQVYIFDLWGHALNNNKQFSQFDASAWNAMTPSDWEDRMRKMGYVRFSSNGGYDYQATVKDALESAVSRRPTPKGEKPLLGVYDGMASTKFINEELYLNQGTVPAADEAGNTRNKRIIERNKVMLESSLKPNITQPDKNKIKLQLMYFSDNESRFRAGDVPDVSFSINGRLNDIALGSGGYISTPDPQKRVKVETTANTFKVVKTETTQGGSGSVNYVYTISGAVQGDKLTGTWVTTYNGKDYMKGEFTADRTVKVNSKGMSESVK